MSLYLPTSSVRSTQKQSLISHEQIPRSNSNLPTSLSSLMSVSQNSTQASEPSQHQHQTLNETRNHKDTHSSPQINNQVSLMSVTPANSTVTYTGLPSLHYLDTLPTSLSKKSGSPKHETWAIDSESDEDPEETDSFYNNWRKNFEKWLLKKNPQKYQEFKSFLKYNQVETEPWVPTTKSHKRSYSSSTTESIREKINHYLVKKPVFDSRISKKFKNKSTEQMLHNMINKKIGPKLSDEVIKLSPIKSSTSTSAEISVKLPSITEILDPETLSNSRKAAQDRRSISTSSVESANSMFSENSANSYFTDPDSYALSPPLLVYKSSHEFCKLPESMSPKIGPSPLKKTSPKRSPTTSSPHHRISKRTCLSCGSSQSPCWRPSWSLTDGQLCNSCGLRYKKTNARCLNENCLRIPAKGEFNLIKSKANNNPQDYKCLRCGTAVEVK